MMELVESQVLDNPVWASLTGPHAHLAETSGRAARYPVDVAPFVGLSAPLDDEVWADLAALAGPGALVVVSSAGGPVAVPAGWDVLRQIVAVQMIDSTVDAAPDPEAEPLGVADIPEMLDLVRRADPGPFLPRTAELGRYLGIRRGGALVAMAGERLRPPGWTEISAVCTDEAHRGQGLAARLIRAVAADIRSRAETPFLHVASFNTNALRLYDSLGFTVRSPVDFRLLRVPEAG